MSGIKISQFVQIVDNEYTTLKITPSKSIHNGSSFRILSLLEDIRKDFKDIVKVENKKFKKFPLLKKVIIEQQNDITYVIDIIKNDVSMFLIFPSQYKTMFMEKVRSVYKSVKLEEVGKIKALETENTYFLSYKNEDALSLKVDKRENRPINSILNILEVLKEKDHLRILYNFKSLSTYEKSSFLMRYKDTIEKIKENQCVIKNKNCSEYRKQMILKFIFKFFKEIDNIFGFLSGTNKKENKSDKTNMADMLFMQLNNNFKLSDSSKNKNSMELVKTNIIVQSISEDEKRENQNAISTIRAFNSLSEDNELMPIKAKKNEHNIDPYKIKDSYNNIMSIEEAGQFIQVPPQEQCKKYRLNYISTFESKVPDELLKGNMCIGFANFREIKKRAYLSNDKEYKNLALAVIGPSRAGKSNLFANLTKNAIDNDECVILLDFISDCKLSSEISEHIPKDKILNINCADIDNLQALDYNELQPLKDTPHEIIKIAREKSKLISNLINCINTTDQELKNRMERYLNSALIIAFVLNKTINDSIRILQETKYRKSCIQELSKDFSKELVFHINALEELTKVDKKIEVNNNYLINGIIDRIERFKSNDIIEKMISIDYSNNINLLEEIEKNKFISIRIPEGSEFDEIEQDILCTFWINKIWLSLQKRDKLIKDRHSRRKVNIIIDEVYTVPNCQKFLNKKVNRIAKFTAKLILSAHYLNQLSMKEELGNSNCSYMFIKGCNVKNFNEMKSDFNHYGYSEEDLLGLKDFHSLNIIKADNDYAAFVTELPKDIILR